VRPPNLEGLIEEYAQERYGNSPAQRALTLIDQTLSNTKLITQDMFIFPGEFEMLCRSAGLRAGIIAGPGITLILAAYAAQYSHRDHSRRDVMKVSCIRELIHTLKDGTI
jgi:hypothetical protein